MKTPEYQPDNLDPKLVNRFDDKSMKEKVSSLSEENKKLIDSALNVVGLSFDQIDDIIVIGDEEQRAKVSELLGDIRLSVDLGAKKTACKSLAEYLKNL